MEKTEAIEFLSALWPFIGIVFLIVLGVLLLNQQFRKKLYSQKIEQEKLKAQHQFDLLQSSIAVQEEERKRIARDLHDELGAALSMARMHLVQIEQQQSQNPELAARLKNVRSMAENALASTRRISHELMPPQLDSFGLIQTLQSTANEINQLNELQLEIISPADLPRLPKQAELGLYRVCMELVNNTIRHAKANRISIRLQNENNTLHLEYRDNGTGLPTGDLRRGIGHLCIQTRIHSMGGNFSITNGETAGILVKAELPLNG